MDYPWIIHGLSMDYPSFRVGPIPRYPIRLLIPIKSYKREVAMCTADESKYIKVNLDWDRRDVKCDFTRHAYMHTSPGSTNCR